MARKTSKAAAGFMVKAMMIMALLGSIPFMLHH